MTPIVVAWVVQVAWEITYCALGTYARSGVSFAIATAVTLATTSVLAIRFAGIAGRSSGFRRAGAYLACGAYVAMLGLFVLRDVLMQAHSPYAMGVARALRASGWSLLDAAAITGLAALAGRRALWLAPPAVGLMLLALPPSAVYLSETPWLAVVFRVIAVTICIVLANDARRAMAPREPRPAAAVRGAHVAERVCWFFVAIDVASLVTGGAYTIGPALTVAIANVLGESTFIVAVWWIAGAGIARLPRVPIYASVVLLLCWLMRTARNWLLTVTLHWGALETVKLSAPHWAYSIPSALSALLALIAYAVYARRTHRTQVLVPAAIATAFEIAHLALWIAGAGHQATTVCLLAANVGAVFVFRGLRPAFQAEVPAHMPSARVV